MISTLVVDDDYRVAHIHAACVDRVHDFNCVGQAHSASEARRMATELRPDLILLDIYLPDEDGLTLFRSLAATLTPSPDCIVITAARDLNTVRAAMGLGAIYYLVKPFGLQQLRDQLEAYSAWRSHTAIGKDLEADQATVDSLYALRHPASRRIGLPPLAPTMARVLEVVSESKSPLSAAAIAGLVGVSRPTAQRYLTNLERRGLVCLRLAYGTTGRPVHLYVAAPGGHRT